MRRGHKLCTNGALQLLRCAIRTRGGYRIFSSANSIGGGGGGGGKGESEGAVCFWPDTKCVRGSIALGRHSITSLLFRPSLKPPSLRHCPKQPLFTVINFTLARVRCVRDRLLFTPSSIVTYSYRGRNSVAHPLYPHQPLSLLRYLKGLGPANRGRLNSNAHPRSKVITATIILIVGTLPS